MHVQQRSKQLLPNTSSHEVEFSVRGPLPATWGSDEDHRSRPGSCILDLIFAAPNKVGELVFRNYYTAWITVLVRTAPSSTAATVATTGGPAGKTPGASRGNASRADVEETLGAWKVSIPRRVLMPFPHQETGSHDVVSIAATESLVDWSSLQAMRLLLQQPSPVWRTFHVEEMAVLRELPRRMTRVHTTPTPAVALEVASLACSTPQHAVSTTSFSENHESRLELLKCQTTTALKKSNAPEREGPPPKDFVGLVGYEVQGLLLL